MKLFPEWSTTSMNLSRFCVVCGLLLGPQYADPEPDPATLPDPPAPIMIVDLPGAYGPHLVHEKCDPAYEWPEPDPDAALALFLATGRGWRRWASTAV